MSDKDKIKVAAALVIMCCIAFDLVGGLIHESKCDNFDYWGEHCKKDECLDRLTHDFNQGKIKLTGGRQR